MIRPCFCVGYKADIMRGVHHEDDRYMLALYPAGADLTPYTKEYSPTGEISGPGYRAGGKNLPDAVLAAVVRATIDTRR